MDEEQRNPAEHINIHMLVNNVNRVEGMLPNPFANIQVRRWGALNDRREVPVVEALENDQEAAPRVGFFTPENRPNPRPIEEREEYVRTPSDRDADEEDYDDIIEVLSFNSGNEASFNSGNEASFGSDSEKSFDNEFEYSEFDSYDTIYNNISFNIALDYGIE